MPRTGALPRRPTDVVGDDASQTGPLVDPATPAHLSGALKRRPDAHASTCRVSSTLDLRQLPGRLLDGRRHDCHRERGGVWRAARAADAPKKPRSCAQRKAHAATMQSTRQPATAKPKMAMPFSSSDMPAKMPAAPPPSGVGGAGGEDGRGGRAGGGGGCGGGGGADGGGDGDGDGGSTGGGGEGSGGGGEGGGYEGEGGERGGGCRGAGGEIGGCCV